MTKNVAIVEPGWTGHRLHYVDYLAMFASDSEVTLWTSHEAAASLEFRRFLNAERLHIRAELKGAAEVGARMQDLRVIAAQARPADVIVFLNAGEYFLPLVFSRLSRLGATIRCIDMRPARGRGPRSLLKHLIVAILKARGVQVRPLVSPMTLARKMGGAPVALDPDGLYEDFQENPSPTGTDVPKEWTVGVLGGISPRKNVLEILRAVATTEDMTMVVAGVPEPGYDNTLKSEAKLLGLQDRVVFELGPISNDRFVHILRRCQVLALVYSNASGSSGLMMHAAVWGVPIVTWGNRESTAACRSHDLGIVAGGRDSASLVAAIKAATKVQLGCGQAATWQAEVRQCWAGLARVP